MALTDVDNKRAILNQKVDAYKQALADFAAGTITQTDVDTAKLEAQQAGDALAKEILSTKQADPNLADDDFFSNPSLMDVTKRSDIATIMTQGVLRTGQLRIKIQTNRSVTDGKIAHLPLKSGSDATVHWGDGSAPQSVTGPVSHTYAAAGTYSVAIEGTIAGFDQTIADYAQLFVDVMEWGDVIFTDMANMFYGRTGFAISADDAPNLAVGCTLSNLFRSANDFNSDISHWDVSNVTSMYGTFWGAAAFNQDISAWDTGRVTDMRYAFREANAFNQDIGGWNTVNVVYMGVMFYGADVFDQDLSAWNVSKVTDYNSSNWAVNSALQSAHYPNF